MKRYEIAQTRTGGVMVEDADGDYVQHDDVAGLLVHLAGTANMLRSACLVINDAEARGMALSQVKAAEALVARATGSAHV